MTQNKSKFQFYQEAILSQRLSAKYPIYRKLAGSDQQISESIGILHYLGEKGIVNKTDVEFIIGLLDVMRMARFATSERTNEITKMGMQMPKDEHEISGAFND